MKTFTSILSIIRYLPMLISLIGKLREAFGSDAVQEVFKEFRKLIDKTSPERSGDDFDTEPEKQRRRLFWLKKRTSVIGEITDAQVLDLYAKHCERKTDTLTA